MPWWMTVIIVVTCEFLFGRIAGLVIGILFDILITVSLKSEEG